MTPEQLRELNDQEDALEAARQSNEAAQNKINLAAVPTNPLDVIKPELSQKLAIQAVEQMRGDDLYRARMAFRGLTSKQMDEQFGQSGKTRRQILSEYELYDAKCNAAIGWLKTLL